MKVPVATRCRPLLGAGLVAAMLLLTTASCGTAGSEEPTTISMRLGPPAGATDTTTDTTASGDTDGGSSGSGTGSSTSGGDVGTAMTQPDWLGSRPLPTTADGSVVPQTTPDELVDRRFVTIDTLAPPPSDAFEATIAPLEGDPLERSTWTPLCPVQVDELRYLTMTFWGFDDKPHTGEMIVNAAHAEDVVGVFESLYENRFPIEEMRIATQADLDALPTGDGNMTTSFVCRLVVGGGDEFSQHAYGLAIDINPFQNPYIKGDLVLPELATSYGDRSDITPGMHEEGGPAVAAFDEIGWGWGGRWQTLKDYQHFSLNSR